MFQKIFRKKGIGEKTGCTEGNQKKEAAFFLSLLDFPCSAPCRRYWKESGAHPGLKENTCEKGRFYMVSKMGCDGCGLLQNVAGPLFCWLYINHISSARRHLEGTNKKRPLPKERAFRFAYLMKPTCLQISAVAASFLSLKITLFCSNRLFPWVSMETISGPNSRTRQFHRVSGMPRSRQ